MYEVLKKKSLLYIEDDVDVLNNISSILNDYFANVYFHLNAEDGCDTLGSKKIDLILVDIELPGISGIEFIKRVREINKEIPVIILSAYTKTDYLLESIDLKIEQYIVKPFTSKKLYALLDKIDSLFENNKKINLNSTVTIELTNTTVSHSNTSFNLTSKELDFLIIMAKNKIVTYNEIDIIWENHVPTQDAIRSFIKQLRKKLPDNTLKNKQSIGYYVQ